MKKSIVIIIFASIFVFLSCEVSVSSVSHLYISNNSDRSVNFEAEKVKGPDDMKIKAWGGRYFPAKSSDEVRDFEITWGAESGTGGLFQPASKGGSVTIKLIVTAGTGGAEIYSEEITLDAGKDKSLEYVGQ